MNVKVVNVSKPNCILKNFLYLGSQQSATAEYIEKYGITHVLSVGVPMLPFQGHRYIKNMYIPCMDSPEQNLIPIINKGIAFIEKALQEKGTILVHCFLGVSRSPAVVIAYLMVIYRYTFEEAFYLVKSQRKFINPNEGFMYQLGNMSIHYNT